MSYFVQDNDCTSQKEAKKYRFRQRHLCKSHWRSKKTIRFSLYTHKELFLRLFPWSIESMLLRVYFLGLGFGIGASVARA